MKFLKFLICAFVLFPSIVYANNLHKNGFSSDTVISALDQSEWSKFYVGGFFSVNQLNNTQSFDITYPPITSKSNGRTDVSSFQLGYNKQVGNFVVGLQATINLTEMDVTDNLGRGSAFVYPDEIKTKVRSLNALNARVGYLFQPQLLLYFRGGLVSARFEYEHAAYGDGWFIGSAKDIRTGWDLGGGIEYLVNKNWSIFVEYDRTYFSSDKVILNYISEFGPIGSHPWDNTNSIELLGFGINYHF